MPPAVEFSGAGKDYRADWRARQIRALGELTLTVPGGTICGLLGPNGSGKSTLLKLAAGLLRPTRGSCRVNGRPAIERDAGLCVGYMPEAPQFYGHWTGREVLVYYAGLSGLRRDAAEQGAATVLAEVDLLAAADRRVEGYSQGMRQRLGLAQALLPEPDMLLLDEPTAALDADASAVVLEVLRGCKARGCTVLVSSHWWMQVAEVGDQVAVLERGELCFAGTPAEFAAQDERQTFSTRRLGAELEAELAEWLGARGRDLQPEAGWRLPRWRRTRAGPSQDNGGAA